MGGCLKNIVGFSILFICIVFCVEQAFCEELPEESTEENDLIMDMQLDNSDKLEKINDNIDIILSDLGTTNNNIDHVNDKVNEIIKMEREEQEARESENDIDYADSFQVLHEDNQKIMISLWCLFGMLLGSKLIKGMFGNG